MGRGGEGGERAQVWGEVKNGFFTEEAFGWPFPNRFWKGRSVFKKSFILLFLEEYVDKLLIIDYFRVTAYTEIFKACTFGSANASLW